MLSLVLISKTLTKLYCFKHDNSTQLSFNVINRIGERYGDIPITA